MDNQIYWIVIFFVYRLFFIWDLGGLPLFFFIYGKWGTRIRPVDCQYSFYGSGSKFNTKDYKNKENKKLFVEIICNNAWIVYSWSMYIQWFMGDE